MRAANPVGRREAGWTLITAMIFLIVMTMVALVSLKMSTTTAQIVGNLQARQATEAAAQQAIEAVVSSYTFVNNPGAPVPAANRCGGEANKMCIDVDGDNVADIEVKIQKANSSDPIKVSCTKFRIKKNNDLDLSKPDDLGCAVSNTNSLGIVQINPDDPSACADTVWDVRAEATDLKTQAVAVVHQGVSVSMDANRDDLCTP